MKPDIYLQIMCFPHTGILFVYSLQEANVNSSNPLITNTTHIVTTKITNKYVYVCMYI